jgi:hypothetical protein
MSFQIIDIDNQPIPLSLLDIDAAEIWGKEPDVKYYATPFHKPEEGFKSIKEEFEFHRSNSNWFDTIGYYIHFKRLECWDKIIADFLEPYKDFNQEEVLNHPHIKPYLDLMNKWKEKGYKPKFVEE